MTSERLCYDREQDSDLFQVQKVLYKMNVLLASKVGTSSLLVDLVSNDSGDVTLVTEDGSVTTNRLLLFLR